MNRFKYQILTGTTGITYQLPVFLESSVDEMGIMVGFDGEIEQIEEFCNFTYIGVGGNSIKLFNTVNTNRLKTLVEADFTVSWGDGSFSGMTMTTPYAAYPENIVHYYAVPGRYDVEITVASPWKVDKLKRNIYVPITGSTFPEDFGELTFTIPYSNPPLTETQTYLEDYRSLTGSTRPTNGVPIQFIAVGKSRMDEKKLYGGSNAYTGLTITANYTGYTVDGLYYMDYPDGYTHITGNTTGSTSSDGTIYFTDEVVYNGMITRNEHLIGFVDIPQISSDIFVERGKQGVMERNLRLGEIDSTGELDIYGNGYFKVRKQ